MMVENPVVGGVGTASSKRTRAGAAAPSADKPAFSVSSATATAGAAPAGADARTIAQVSGFNQAGAELSQSHLDAAVRLLLRSRDLSVQVGTESADTVGTSEGENTESSAGADGAGRAVATYLEIQKLVGA